MFLVKYSISILLLHCLLILNFTTTGCFANKAGAPLQTSDSFFISLENHWLLALRQHETLYLNQLLAPDFIDITYKGELKTKSDILSLAANDNKNMKEQLTGIKVCEYKNTAVVTGVNNITLKDINQKILIRFTDVFVKKEKHWCAVSAQETLVK